MSGRDPLHFPLISLSAFSGLLAIFLSMSLLITDSGWQGVNDTNVYREDMTMSSKKRMAAVALTVAALSLGSAGVASADHKGGAKGVAKSAAHDVKRAANKAAHDSQHAAKEALIATTIGLDAATIKTRLAAGESLATIAGTKKDALIAALVAFRTQNIDARVAAGTMTAAQATEKKTNLTAHVTERVNAVGGKGMGHKGPKPPKGPKAPKAPRP